MDTTKIELEGFELLREGDTPYRPFKIYDENRNPLHTWQQPELIQVMASRIEALEKRLGLRSHTDGEDKVVMATAHTDDHNMEVSFNVAPYLRQASGGEILSLMEELWCDSDEADQVLIYCYENGDSDTYPLFEYLKIINSQVGEGIGYEVEIDEDAAMLFLENERPDLEGLIENHRMGG